MSLDRKRDAERVVRRWDRAFTALAAEPRRQLVDALMDARDEESVSLPGAAENPRRSIDRESFRVTLSHTHLPLLESDGYVRWDRSPFRAYRGPRFEEVAVVLESLYANVSAIPEQLIHGCRTLEQQRNRDGESRGPEDSTSMSD
ncbi:hypothetical protein [Halobiforma nitratireducens]|uniref:Uncharacterized protein n=1 Tax=Halobiforma nitratireducens JCM 10879 TaxID=1227454 RepID=M0MPU1_9EURY|nr:hypothetical protein [Halobiforma nitratireducens]EMA46475.1 hypothetical protein C446_01358 [Halobiforma nitratireducens JCM 10879]